ncbi:MAG TPA: Holliday junction branch migration protein RuvA [Thiothrix sp.]|nr:Holliday junction branch migration protein RuvA [Thiothrix sp.]
MIGRLRGSIVYKKAPELMLEVSGVGYELLASVTTFADLPEVDQQAVLFTHFVVREDSQTLYAFSTLSERSLFRTLLKVNGVGPKMALAIVSGMTVNEFAQRIHAGDITGLTKLPGVGKKTAERLIIEMRDRLVDVIQTTTGDSNTATLPLSVNHEEEAVTALLALGYKPIQASKMVSAVADVSLSVEEIIRQALKASLQ